MLMLMGMSSSKEMLGKMDMEYKSADKVEYKSSEKVQDAANKMKAKSTI